MVLFVSCLFLAENVKLLYYYYFILVFKESNNMKLGITNKYFYASIKMELYCTKLFNKTRKKLLTDQLRQKYKKM